MTTRSRRIADSERIKARVRRMIPLVWGYVPDDRAVGLAASTHMKPCSCNGCSGYKYDRRADKRHARSVVHDYTQAAYEKTGGPTSELRRVYNAYLENEKKTRRRSE